MSRDYKNVPRHATEGRRIPGWFWLLTGLTIGLFVAFLVHLNARAPAPPPHAAPAPAAVAPPTTPQQAQRDAREVRKERSEAIAPPAKPRFDFYTLLPEMEVVIPEHEISGKPKQGIAQVEKPGAYLLQVGSFRKVEEADRLKASLALLGIEANIQAVTIKNEAWYRVRVGPYDDLDRLNAIRARLKENAINTVLLKLDT